MALAPYNITALEEDFATAQLSGKNIVAGALITLATTGGTPVLMADDSAGSNPSLTKLTDALGQKVIWVETDVYDLTVDGNASIRIAVASGDDITPETQAALDLKVDTATTNFNEFGGLAANDYLAQGAARSTTLVNFLLPINMFLTPTTITVTGTFQIRRPDLTTLATLVTPTLNSLTSNKIAVLECAITGAVVNEPLILLSTDASSKIVVNA